MCDGWVRGAEPYVRLRARAVCVRACACAWVGSFDVPWAGGACLETELHLCNSFPRNCTYAMVFLNPLRLLVSSLRLPSPPLHTHPHPHPFPSTPLLPPFLTAHAQTRPTTSSATTRPPSTGRRSPPPRRRRHGPTTDSPRRAAASSSLAASALQAHIARPRARLTAAPSQGLSPGSTALLLQLLTLPPGC